MTLFLVGGSSDMGIALIRTISNRYDKIVLHYRTMTPVLSDLQQQYGGKLVLVHADLEDSLQIAEMMNGIVQQGLVPDHIVHLAAPLCENGRFHKIPLSVFRDNMQIGLFSLIQIAQSILPAMSKKKGGKLVVMLSDVLKDMPPAYCSQYVIAKYAMLGLMRALSVEYAGKNISVNAVSPGWTRTKYIRNQPELLVEKYIQHSAHGELLTPEQVAGVIGMLLSEEADHLNGQNIFIS